MADNKVLPETENLKGDDKKLWRKGGKLTCAFFISNALLLIVTLVILGLLLSQIIDASVSFTAGLSILSYCVLAVCILMFITTIIGSNAALIESIPWLCAYSVAVLIVVFTQIALFIYLFVEIRNVEGLVNQIWLESSGSVKNNIQAKFLCCGFIDYTEYTSKTNFTSADMENGIIDISCLIDQSYNTYQVIQVGCKSGIEQWFTRQYWILLILLFLYATMQMVTYVLSWVLLRRLDRLRMERLKIIEKSVAKKWISKVKNKNGYSTKSSLSKVFSKGAHTNTATPEWKSKAMNTKKMWQPVNHPFKEIKDKPQAMWSSKDRGLLRQNISQWGTIQDKF